MEQIIINQNDRQQINILSNEPQFIRLTNNNPQDININLNKNQDVNIKNSDNQILYVKETGSVVGISDVLVNGVSVVSDNIAYVLIPTKTSQLINDSGYITNENDPTVPSYIKQITLSEINSWNNKQDYLVSGSNIKTINNNSLLGSGNLTIGGANYTAGTGININSENVISNTITSYNSLSDLPNIPTETSELTNDSGFVSSNELSIVAFTGSYDDLIDEPTVPTNTSELVNDSGYIDKDVNDLTYYTLSSNLSAVATSGDYSDLSGTPTIPTNLSELNNDSGYVKNTDYATGSTGGVVKGNTNGFMVNSVTGTPSANTYNYSEYTSHTNGVFIGKGTLENALTGKGYITNTVNNLTNYTLTSNLSTVATSGDYNDLSNKPTIPTLPSLINNTSSMVRNTTYCTSAGYLNCYSYGKLCVVSFNVNLASNIPNNSTLISGLPTCAATRVTFCGASASTIYRFYVEGDKICNDGAITNGGWMNSSIVYPIN